MPGPSRQYLVILALLCAVTAWLLASAFQLRNRTIETGFWFEAVTFDESQPMAERLGGPVTKEEMRAIQSIARAAEVVRAFELSESW